jgi:hypothetical protein
MTYKTTIKIITFSTILTLISTSSIVFGMDKIRCIILEQDNGTYQVEYHIDNQTYASNINTLTQGRYLKLPTHNKNNLTRIEFNYHAKINSINQTQKTINISTIETSNDLSTIESHQTTENDINWTNSTSKNISFNDDLYNTIKNISCDTKQRTTKILLVSNTVSSLHNNNLYTIYPKKIAIPSSTHSSQFNSIIYYIGIPVTFLAFIVASYCIKILIKR